MSFQYFRLYRYRINRYTTERRVDSITNGEDMFQYILYGTIFAQAGIQFQIEGVSCFEIMNKGYDIAKDLCVKLKVVLS